jgi:hypothetical protein
MDRRDELLTMAFAEISEADGDDKERLEPFTKGDDKRLQHRRLPRDLLLGWRNETESRFQTGV